MKVRNCELTAVNYGITLIPNVMRSVAVINCLQTVVTSKEVKVGYGYKQE
jgi:hypothetical protein